MRRELSLLVASGWRESERCAGRTSPGASIYCRAMDGFKVVVPLAVTFRDTDAMRHANNAVYLTWFECGRIEYWRAMAGPEADYAEVPFVLARAEIDFRAPCYAGDRMHLGIRATRVGNRSFDFAYRLVRDTAERLLAEGTSVQVMYDYQAAASMPMGDDFRRRFYEIDGEHLTTDC